MTSKFMDMQPPTMKPETQWRDVVMRWHWWSHVHQRTPSLAEVLRQTLENHLRSNGYKPARYFPGTHVVVGTSPPIPLENWLRSNKHFPFHVTQFPMDEISVVTRAPPARMETTFRWSFVLAVVLIVLLVIKLAEKCVDFGMYRSLRRRNSEEWATPNVTATNRLNASELDSDTHSPLEYTESMRNDYPPPYSTVNKDFPNDPPPPYSSCTVTFSNPKDGLPSVHFYNNRHENFLSEREIRSMQVRNVIYRLRNDEYASPSFVDRLPVVRNGGMGREGEQNGNRDNNNEESSSADNNDTRANVEENQNDNEIHGDMGTGDIEASKPTSSVTEVNERTPKDNRRNQRNLDKIRKLPKKSKRSLETDDTDESAEDVPENTIPDTEIIQQTTTTVTIDLNPNIDSSKTDNGSKTTDTTEVTVKND